MVTRVEPRPEIVSGEPKFLICNSCGNLVIQERSEKQNVKISCCNMPMKELTPNSIDLYSEEHIPIITFTGGFERNAANVKFGKIPHPMTKDHHIEWVYLRTSEGGQFKRMKLNKEPEANFSMADDDAYAYCNRPICNMGRRHCNFKCKRGFAAYIYCNIHGLWKTQM